MKAREESAKELENAGVCDMCHVAPSSRCVRDQSEEGKRAGCLCENAQRTHVCHHDLNIARHDGHLVQDSV